MKKSKTQSARRKARSAPPSCSVICDLKYIIGAGGHEYAGSKADTLAAMKAAVRELRRLQMAVRWALGEVGDFPTRQPGQGAYWWRTELRKRAGLSPTMSQAKWRTGNAKINQRPSPATFASAIGCGTSKTK